MGRHAVKLIAIADGRTITARSANSAGVTLAGAQVTIRVAVLSAIVDDEHAVRDAARLANVPADVVLKVIRALAQSA